MKIRTGLLSLVCLAASAILVTAAPGFAWDAATAVYYIPTTYDTSAKVGTLVKGAYAYLGTGAHSLELGHDQIALTSSGENIQWNYLGIYTYRLPTSQWKAGYSRINGGTLIGNIGILGGASDIYNQWGYKSWSYGLDVYGGFYDNGGTPFTVMQYMPYGTYHFVPPYLPGYANITGKVSYVSDSQTSTYLAYEAELKYYVGLWTIESQYWLGETTWGVTNGGFVINNTSDVLKDGYNIAASYQLLPKLSGKLEYQSRRGDTTDGVRFQQTKVSYMLTYVF
jgi:hypothetical protein